MPKCPCQCHTVHTVGKSRLRTLCARRRPASQEPSGGCGSAWGREQEAPAPRAGDDTPGRPDARNVTTQGARTAPGTPNALTICHNLPDVRSLSIVASKANDRRVFRQRLRRRRLESALQHCSYSARPGHSPESQGTSPGILSAQVGTHPVMGKRLVHRCPDSFRGIRKPAR